MTAAAGTRAARSRPTRGRPASWNVLPGLIALAICYFLPLATVVPQLWADGGVSIAQAVSPLYLSVAGNTLAISLITTVITLVVSFPLAWMISRANGARRLLLILLVLVPFLTSVLVRTFSWVVILGRDGLINSALQAMGLTDRPLEMIFTTGAVVVALVHVTIPLMVFSLVTVMQRIDTRILLVARSLGAGSPTAFLRVIVPLSIPGIRSGAILVFLFSMATFIAPAVLGGTDQTMIAQVIQSQIETGFNWSLAASLGLVLAVIALIIVGLIGIVSRWLTPWLHARRSAGSGSERTGAATGVLREQLPTRHLIPPAVRRVGRIAATFGRHTYVPLSTIFMLLPLVVLFPMAFTDDDTILFPPRNYSFRWFESVLTSQKWMDAALTSLRIGSVVAVVATALAVLLVLGLGRSRNPLTGLIESVVMAPLSIPTVVFALGAYLAYSQLFRWTGRTLRLTDSEIGIVIAHTALGLPFAFVLVSAAYVGVDTMLERAGASLGASPRRILTRITLPLMAPGIVASLLLCFLHSFDESVVSLFLSGLHVSTLPRLLWDGIRFGTSPDVAAVSALLLLLTCIIIGLIGVLLAWRQRQQSLSGGQGRAPL
ncbi:ABC transporter permease subunit [Saccharopolyspora sp. ASAGF58]|uniref:ABC transporter permease subunit n=1 Tax=Saccharopolyspora sp. ASAGF58 TaxID=2719023 RepID=UPI0014400070|nr:ABC transporter permease subunit [Saccharopolyspora sp. ASAGF58]QIZ37179.1 ABC transporter permease subunit [Saccharopolyspora sp. ASAGF58]